MLNRGEGGRGREETIKRGLDERYYCYEIFFGILIPTSPSKYLKEIIFKIIQTN